MKILPLYPTPSVPDGNQVYPPREDSFLLHEVALLEISPEDYVLEVGTGTGFVISDLPDCRMIVGTDINPHAVLIAHDNGVMAVRTDMVRGLKRIFTLILFNPPYLPTLHSERINDWLEYALDGGVDGRETLSRFLAEIPGIMASKGRILILISELQDFEICENLFLSSGFFWEIIERRLLEDGENLRVYRLKRN